MISVSDLFREFYEDSDRILNEEVEYDIDGDQVLYEDKQFSDTIDTATEKRQAAEEVLGFELNGNQIQFLADNWKKFYSDATKYSNMKDDILQSLQEEGLLSDEQAESDVSTLIDETPEEQDYDDDLADGELMDFTLPDGAEEQIKQSEISQFNPMQVQSWDSGGQKEQELQKIEAVPEDEIVDVLPEDDIDENEVNKALMSLSKS